MTGGLDAGTVEAEGASPAARRSLMPPANCSPRRLPLSVTAWAVSVFVAARPHAAHAGGSSVRYRV